MFASTLRAVSKGFANQAIAARRSQNVVASSGKYIHIWYEEVSLIRVSKSIVWPPDSEHCDLCVLIYGV